jgi:hypothetical protein
MGPEVKQSMQISPIPGPTWANPAAAAQQAFAEQKGSSSPGHAGATPHPAIGDVEQSAETLDRDADGRYEGSGSESEARRQPSEPDGSSTESSSILQLPAQQDDCGSSLDLLG